MSDGKMGDLSQCRGVANALTTGEHITEYVVTPNWITALPLPNMPISAVDRQQEVFSKKFDIVIASGRRTIPYLRAFKNLSIPAPLCVFLKDPRWIGRSVPDVTWAPTHDKIPDGANVIQTHTSPHNLTNEVLSGAKKSAVTRFKSYPSPVTGILLGGDTGPVVWNAENSAEFAKSLSQIPNDNSVLITHSRRTPEVLLKSVTNALKNYRLWLSDASDENPYVQIIAHADRLIVTADSHNMVSEALVSGKPVHVYRPPNLQPKFVSFLNTLENDGAIKNLADGLKPFPGKRIDATPEIANFIREKLSA